MRTIFQARRGPQASVNRSERFLRLSGDDVAITMCPIAQTIVIIHRSLVLHATFLHHTSGSGILSFTFHVDQPGSQHRKGIGKGRLKRFRHIFILARYRLHLVAQPVGLALPLQFPRCHRPSYSELSAALSVILYVIRLL